MKSKQVSYQEKHKIGEIATMNQTIKLKISENKIKQLSVRTMAFCPMRKYLFCGGEICLQSDKTKRPHIVMVDIAGRSKEGR